MFSLIISIIAIALVAALALASIYYGGDAFQEGTAKAEASTVINQGQQVQAAFTMAEIDEKDEVAGGITLATLVSDGYLKENPQVRNNGGWAFDSTNDVVTQSVHSAEVCAHVEAGFDGVSTVENVTEMKDVTAKQAFGCFGDGTNHTAYYKL